MASGPGAWESDIGARSLRALTSRSRIKLPKGWREIGIFTWTRTEWKFLFEKFETSKPQITNVKRDDRMRKFGFFCSWHGCKEFGHKVFFESFSRSIKKMHYLRFLSPLFDPWNDSLFYDNSSFGRPLKYHKKLVHFIFIKIFFRSGFNVCLVTHTQHSTHFRRIITHRRN